MSRHEFSKKTKKLAMERSGGRCEAIGEVYGLTPSWRCDVSLSDWVEYDHYPIPATDEGSNVLANCVAVCPACHKIKTFRYDIPMQAKGKRIRRKAGPADLRRNTKPIPSRKAPMQSRPFQQRTKP